MEGFHAVKPACYDKAGRKIFDGIARFDPFLVQMLNRCAGIETFFFGKSMVKYLKDGD